MPESGQWRWSKERSYQAIKNYQKMLFETGYSEHDDIPQKVIDGWYIKQNKELDMLRLSSSGKPEHYIAPKNETLINNSWVDLLVGSSSEINHLFESKVFETAKLTATIKRMIRFAEKSAVILDFFSGSATTAHAVMQLNAEDGGNRKFIMVQIPEPCDEKSEAFKAGYKNICEIGKERIRRAGKRIVEGYADLVNAFRSGKLQNGEAYAEWTTSDKAKQTQDEVMKFLDVGFRVLKLDSTNMKDVYYNPDDYEPSMFDSLVSNIKEDRTPEDLLFQVMLDLGILLSSKIEETTIAGKKVFTVEDGFLIACFDSNINEEAITEIAKRKPYYFVMRNSSVANNDDILTNFDQIFEAYSPDTKREVL